MSTGCFDTRSEWLCNAIGGLQGILSSTTDEQHGLQHANKVEILKKTKRQTFTFQATSGPLPVHLRYLLSTISCVVHLSIFFFFSLTLSCRERLLEHALDFRFRAIALHLLHHQRYFYRTYYHQLLSLQKHCKCTAINVEFPSNSSACRSFRDSICSEQSFLI